MASNLRKPSLYEGVFFAEHPNRRDLLRQTGFGDLDLDNFVEEIKTLGHPEQRELESAYRLIAMNLLKPFLPPALTEAFPEAAARHS